MRRLLLTAFFMAFAVILADAQGALKRVYDESVDPMAQIDGALAKARAENKFVVCQVGGNWCPWCLRFADFADKDTAVNRAIDENFVLIHVNYNPRKSAGSGAAENAARLMRRLDNPARFGFPVFVVLDADGSVLHIQDSSFLEDGQSYSQKKTLRFLKNWTPEAVGKQN